MVKRSAGEQVTEAMGKDTEARRAAKRQRRFERLAEKMAEERVLAAVVESNDSDGRKYCEHRFEGLSSYITSADTIVPVERAWEDIVKDEAPTAAIASSAAQESLQTPEATA